MGSADNIAVVGHIHTPVMFCKGVRFFHSVSYGNILGGGVCVPDNRANFFCLEGFKGVFFTGSCGLRCITFVPVCPVKKVSDFQHFGFFPGLHGKPALSNHNAGFFQYYCPQAEIPFSVAGNLPVKPFLHFLG